MLGIADYFWRLLPANPILLRVVSIGGRRWRDLLYRCAYLGLLIGVVLISLAVNSIGESLSELAKTSSMLFERMSYCQLGLVALLAPIFTAGAITQERDSQTYDILLATPLTNGQIVLGTLLSRQFFIVALLISGIPIFSITQIFGGVTTTSIVQSFGIAAATAFVTGALAMAIAVFKIGSRRTIFGFYLFIVIYLAGLYMLDQVPWFKIPVLDPATGQTTLSSTSWLTGLQPFLALHVIFHDPAYSPPEFGNLPANLRYWPVSWYLTDPAGFYTAFMFLLSFVLVLPSIVLLRRLAQNTLTLRAAVLQRLHIGRSDRTRKPRPVWNNPIAWREAKTKASATRASLLRYTFIAAGLIGALVLLVLYSTLVPNSARRHYVDGTSYTPSYNQLTVYSLDDPSPITLPLSDSTTYTVDGQTSATLPAIDGRMEVDAVPTVDVAGAAKTWQSISIFSPTRKLSAADARQWLLVFILIEFSVILLIVTNAAASTVTREKEDGTLDLLLSTPITSRYYVWGKLRGLVSFVLPLCAVPVISALLFVGHDLFSMLIHHGDPSSQWIVFPESVVLMPAMVIIVCAFAAILGMQMSLRCRKSVVAVMASIGIMVLICGLMGFCGFQVLNSNNAPFGPIVGSASPFTLISMLVDPSIFTGDAFAAQNATSDRILICIFSLAAVGLYTAIVWFMYRSMVKNFDMTIRRQQR
ncbi:MAG TPA: ABC transporter permease subunit [Tepidisphaeraceae bacterium]|nr:ABC transporter permease subunit [Tepidisphaeraceae bacterium]